MKTRILVGVLGVALSLSVARPSGADAPADPSGGLPGARAARETSLESLAWLAGHWQSEAEEGAELLEELWMPPRGGLMLGLNRSTPPDGGRAFFEYLRIELREEGPVYVASPGGGPSTPFAMTECKQNHAVFANPEHDFPKRIVYTRTAEELVAQVLGDDGQGLELRWQRVGDVR